MTTHDNAQHNEGEGLKPRLLNVDGLSRYISMPTASIYTYVSLGKIPASCIRRIGRALKFDREAIDAWVAEQGAHQGPSQ
jgi:predicted DNA-binding transcriptional regulator AlpA